MKAKRLFIVRMLPLFFGAFSLVSSVKSQCLQISVTTQDATCANNDGQITLNITPGTDAQGPFYVDLYSWFDGGGHMASYEGVTSTSLTFAKGDGSLNLPQGDSIGIPANDFVDNGSQYLVNVIAASGTGNYPCRAKSLFFTVGQTPDLEVTVDEITPDTDPTPDVGTGSISITVSGGIAPYTYLWNDGATTEDRTDLDADPACCAVRFTDSNGCSERHSFTIEQALLSTITKSSSLVSPNPASESVTLQLAEEFDERTLIQILDMQGNLREQMTAGNSRTLTISVKHLESGMYILKLVDGEKLYAERIQVE